MPTSSTIPRVAHRIFSCDPASSANQDPPPCTQQGTNATQNAPPLWQTTGTESPEALNPFPHTPDSGTFDSTCSLWIFLGGSPLRIRPDRGNACGQCQPQTHANHPPCRPVSGQDYPSPSGQSGTCAHTASLHNPQNLGHPVFRP